MRGSEVCTELTKMKDWTPLTRFSDTMKITASENEEIVLSCSLRKAMNEKIGESWNVRVYATEDMKIIVLHPDAQSNFKYPKNGRRNFKTYIQNLKRKGYKIPAVYDVEWNENLYAWVGTLQEVAEIPRLDRRKNVK